METLTFIGLMVALWIALGWRPKDSVSTSAGYAEDFRQHLESLGIRAEVSAIGGPESVLPPDLVLEPCSGEWGVRDLGIVSILDAGPIFWAGLRGRFEVPAEQTAVDLFHIYAFLGVRDPRLKRIPALADVHLRRSTRNWLWGKHEPMWHGEELGLMLLEALMDQPAVGQTRGMTIRAHADQGYWSLMCEVAQFRPDGGWAVYLFKEDEWASSLRIAEVLLSTPVEGLGEPA